MAERELTEEERREEEERRKKNLPSLDEDIARRYDPSRLSKLVVKGAGRGERLDLATRGDMERLHPGHDFSNVRIFRGAFAEEVTARHKADAVTIANTGMILMRDGARSAPGTTSHRALLAHEVTHVAQAQRGMHFALAHEHGHGDHEHAAEEVESEVASGGTHLRHQENEGAKEERELARREAIMARAFELFGEHRRVMRDRSGMEHE